MASTGAAFSASQTEDASGTVWADLANVEASDDSYTTCAIPKLGTSKILVAYEFSFSVPAGATIDGVEFKVEWWADDIAMKDITVILYEDADTTPATIGSDQGDNEDIPGSETVETYGGSSDTWGATLTSTIVNSTGFGVGVRITHPDFGADDTVSIDGMTLNIFYTAAGGADLLRRSLKPFRHNLRR